MLDEWAKYQLKLNHINEEDVDEMSTDCVVTFKDGTKRRVCQIYSRVMGYIRPTTDFNIGKYSEFVTRKNYCEQKAVEGPDDAA